MYSSIVENLARHSLVHPDRLCLADEKKSLTYKDVWCRVLNLASQLKKNGIANGTALLVECDQSVEYMIFALATQLNKAVFVPLENNVSLDRIKEIAKDTKATIYAGKRNLSEQLPDLCNIPLTDALEKDSTAADMDINNIEFPCASDVAEILFSTGTTGKSKGIVLTHGNNIAIAENVITGLHIKENNIEMITMPTSHSHGLRRAYSNLANGSSVVLIGGVMMVKKLFTMVEEYKVTSMDLSPSMLSILFKLSKDMLGQYADTMDYIQLGSAPLPEEDKEHLRRILPRTRLYNFYGSTECGCSCLLDFNEAPGKKGCIGKPAVNNTFIVVDEDHHPIQSSPDHLGFLASRGSNMMKEYLNAPELTKEALPDGITLYSKDLGYIDDNGFVYMLGRKDDVINFGGIKISPEEIESQVIKYPAIKDCACIPIDSPLSGQAPKLYIQLENNTSFDLTDFRCFLSEKLDASKFPTVIEEIDEIPRTFNGKIIRKQLISLNK